MSPYLEALVVRPETIARNLAAGLLTLLDNPPVNARTVKARKDRAPAVPAAPKTAEQRRTEAKNRMARLRWRRKYAADPTKLLPEQDVPDAYALAR